jgi:hypothetical protein
MNTDVHGIRDGAATPTLVPLAIENPKIMSPPREEFVPRITHGYGQGFQDGFHAASAVASGVVPAIGAWLALIIIVVLLMRHISRLVGIIAEVLIETDAKRILPVVALALALSACAGKKPDPAPTVSLPSQTAEQQKKEGPSLAYADDEHKQYLLVSVPADASAEARRGEPQELVGLLEMKGTGEKETTVSMLRPTAIRDAAQLVALQTAITWRYKQLLASTEQYAAILDAAFDFSPLLMTEGEALILPPVLSRSGASLRIEKPDAASSAQSAYELLAPARFVPFAPHWREFLMEKDFPVPERPNPAVLPKNGNERAVWRAAVREAWAQGLAEADQLYADNVARMARQYRGVLLYHLLTAQRLLSKVGSASANQPLSASDTKLYIEQGVYRITAPSRFLTNVKE